MRVDRPSVGAQCKIGELDSVSLLGLQQLSEAIDEGSAALIHRDHWVDLCEISVLLWGESLVL